MNVGWRLLSTAHYLGLVLAVGAASVKLVLLFASGRDRALLPAFLAVSKPVTRLIIVGMILMTLSGIGWLLSGYPLTTLLVVKLVLVGALWVLGPVIDNAIEPRFHRVASAPETVGTPEYVRVRRRFAAWEVTATLLFYVTIVLWVWRT